MEPGQDPRQLLRDTPTAPQEPPQNLPLPHPNAKRDKTPKGTSSSSQRAAGGSRCAFQGTRIYLQLPRVPAVPWQLQVWSVSATYRDPLCPSSRRAPQNPTSNEIKSWSKQNPLCSSAAPGHGEGGRGGQGERGFCFLSATDPHNRMRSGCESGNKRLWFCSGTNSSQGRAGTFPFQPGGDSGETPEGQLHL